MTTSKAVRLFNKLCMFWQSQKGMVYPRWRLKGPRMTLQDFLVQYDVLCPDYVRSIVSGPTKGSKPLPRWGL